MSELNKSLDELSELTDGLEESSTKAIAAIRDLLSVWDMDADQIDELEQTITELVSDLREMIGDLRV